MTFKKVKAKAIELAGKAKDKMRVAALALAGGAVVMTSKADAAVADVVFSSTIQTSIKDGIQELVDMVGTIAGVAVPIVLVAILTLQGVKVLFKVVKGAIAHIG